jgi:hypothetical protein
VVYRYSHFNFHTDHFVVSVPNEGSISEIWTQCLILCRLDALRQLLYGKLPAEQSVSYLNINILSLNFSQNRNFEATVNCSSRDYENSVYYASISHDISDKRFCLRLQVQPNHLAPTELLPPEYVPP